MLYIYILKLYICILKYIYVYVYINIYIYIYSLSSTISATPVLLISSRFTSVSPLQGTSGSTWKESQQVQPAISPDHHMSLHSFTLIISYISSDNFYLDW